MRRPDSHGIWITWVWAKQKQPRIRGGRQILIEHVSVHLENQFLFHKATEGELILKVVIIVLAWIHKDTEQLHTLLDLI